MYDECELYNAYKTYKTLVWGVNNSITHFLIHIDKSKNRICYIKVGPIIVQLRNIFKISYTCSIQNMLFMPITDEKQPQNPGWAVNVDHLINKYVSPLLNVLWSCSNCSDDGRLSNSLTAIYWNCLFRKRGWKNRNRNEYENE